ncbi:MAG TPA: hypothetical protein VHE83_12460 [Mycobacteriales bacterium]|nr:hypothetical protein [Mycobacteriales bacterium]
MKARLSRSAIAAAPHAARRAAAAIWRDPAALALATAVVMAGLYLIFVPHVGDLAAQVARAQAARRTGGSVWWGGWYGGIVTPPYSLLTGPVMGFLGVALTGALAMASSAWLAGHLLRSTPRPRAGALAATAALGADLLAGRITFAVGLAATLAALVLLQNRRGAWAVLPAVLSGLLSPLAAMFLGLVALAVVFVDRTRRGSAFLVGVAAAVPVVVISALFPDASFQPVRASSLWAPMLTCTAIACLRMPRVVRVTAALSAFTVGIAWLVPSPIGSNAQRLALIAAAPVAVALVRLPRRWLAALVVGLAAWPTVDVATSFAQATDPSSSHAYYAQLVAMLPSGPVDGRLEVVEPASHWSSAYVAARVPLARGWERQVDAAVNPEFYKAGALTADSYRQWLGDNAVHWVAVPDASLDFGSRTEAKLIESGLPYLRLAWWTDHWKLYVVDGATSIADAPVASKALLADSTVTITVARPGATRVRVRWSPDLALSGPVGCLTPVSTTNGDNATWMQLTAVLPGTYVIHSSFSPLGGRRSAVCTSGFSHELPTNAS